MYVLKRQRKILSLLSSCSLSIFVFANLIYLTTPAPQKQNLPKAAAIDIFAPSIAHASVPSPFPLVTPKQNAINSIPSPYQIQSGQFAPTPPALPSMPQNGAYYSVEKVVVLGVLPPNVAIISQAGKAITVRSGYNSSYGYIGAVTTSGVEIDDEFITLEGRG